VKRSSAPRIVPLAIAALVVTACSGATEEEAPPAPVEVTILGPAFETQHAEIARLAWGPSVVDAAHARVRAASLPLEQAAGMVIVASWNSPDAAGAADLVAREHLAGVILMGDAIASREQVIATTSAVAAAAAQDDRWWPAVISTDQEGGPVARLRGLGPDLPAFMAAGSATDEASVTAAYAAQARDMAQLGFTVDWAPIADVTHGAGDTTIGVRSAGTDPARVSAAVVAATQGFLSAGVIPSAKHFPGHGSVTTDSHVGLPVQSASLDALAARDFVPFATAIEQGIPMVMTGHIAVSEWGSAPATTTPAAYDYLRNELAFTGVVVTDAMNMAGVADFYGPGAAEVAALAAGADLLLMPRDPASARQAIITAVMDGSLPRSRLDEAVGRVSLMMEWQARLSAQADLAPVDASYARQAAATWATVSSPACGGTLVGDSVTLRGGWPAERAILAQALAEHGISEGGGTSVLLLGSGGASGTADVVVAMDAPWGLPASSATTYVGLYGRSADALRGLADVLAGAVAPAGTWAMPGMPPACADSVG
jgi:beta-glucosidase-like glycosyl hydrolase